MCNYYVKNSENCGPAKWCFFEKSLPIKPYIWGNRGGRKSLNERGLTEPRVATLRIKRNYWNAMANRNPFHTLLLYLVMKVINLAVHW